MLIVSSSFSEAMFSHFSRAARSCLLSCSKSRVKLISLQQSPFYISEK